MGHVRALSVIAVLACVFMCSCSTSTGLSRTSSSFVRAAFPGLPPITAQAGPQPTGQPMRPIERQQEIEISGMLGMGVFFISDGDLEDFFGSTSIAPTIGVNLWFNDNVVGRGEFEFHTWEGEEGFGEMWMDNYIFRFTGQYLPMMDDPRGGPYFGGGLCIYMTDWWYEGPVWGIWRDEHASETDIGLSLLGGYRFKMKSGNTFMLELVIDIVEGEAMDEDYNVGGFSIKAVFEF